ncbi:glycosyl transferase [Obelidium mucronatum]|nr:glycosyl transferase [Obelidium mucronatum]
MIFRRKAVLAFSALAIIVVLILISSKATRIAHVITYATRPLWDTGEGTLFTTIIPFYPPPSIANASSLCKAHGWSPKNQQTVKSKVFDVTLFSVELDMLELRIKELDPVTDFFVIVESKHSFTGNPKNLTFAAHKSRFDFAKDKIRYKAIEGRPLKFKGEDPFNIEGEMRGEVTMFLQSLGVATGDTVIMADVDEIPSREAISLISACMGVPPKLHLRMRNFLYSYDFQQDAEHWRAKAVTVDDPLTLRYTHGKESDSILSDSGWHCSFCFPKLSDFAFKMKAYSHADRVTNANLLTPERIQKVICDGTDIFDMLPEAYTFRDLAYKWGPLKRLESAVGLPKYLTEAVAVGDTRFKYLLPGGCIREQ